MTKNGGLEDMVEKTFVFSDIHFPNHDEKALSCAEKIMADLQPDRVIYIGDNMDMEPVSHWIEDKKRVVENKRLIREYELWNKVLDRHTKLAGKRLKEVVYFEGNHENWVQQYLDKHPEVEGLLEVPKNLEFDKRKKFKWIKLNHFYNLGKLKVCHGLYQNKYHANKMLENLGTSVLYGHTHDVQVQTFSSIADVHQKHQAMSIGTLSSKTPDYMFNRPNRWMHSCAVVYTDVNGHFNAYIINIINGKAMFNGKLYRG